MTFERMDAEANPAVSGLRCLLGGGGWGVKQRELGAWDRRQEAREAA